MKGSIWHLEKRIGHLQTWSALPLFESVKFTYASTLNNPSTISAIDDTSTLKDALAPTLNFTISDTETVSGSLIVSVTSDNRNFGPLDFDQQQKNTVISFKGEDIAILIGVDVEQLTSADF
ncbi:MAG: hypothetical protein VKL39_15155 [Leptolyngbyaceae bacterium]|nr:hypothetical protein [Leptolyngbyaceae bacterium]